GIARTSDQAERPSLRWQTVVDFRLWIVELRVIENVERFKAQFQLLGLSNLRVLRQRHVKIIQSRAMEETASRVSELTKRFVGEKGWIEVGTSMARVGITDDVSARKVGNVHRNCVGANQGIVVVLG